MALEVDFVIDHYRNFANEIPVRENFTLIPTGPFRSGI